MATRPADQREDVDARTGPIPVRTVSFGMLSMLIECAASNMGAGLPSDGGDVDVKVRHVADLAEARLAIDAANALLAVVGRSLGSDERHAIEGLLTQLQIEYVKRARNG